MHIASFDPVMCYTKGQFYYIVLPLRFSKRKQKGKVMLIQEQLNEAELILKTALEDENTTSRKYLQALVITYFKTKKERNTDE